MVVNELLMQFQADILNREVVRPVIQENDGAGAQRMPRGWLSSFFLRVGRTARQLAVDRTWNQIWPKQSGSNSTSSGRKRLRDRLTGSDPDGGCDS